eukprot:5215169-Prymnesium_polylepis.1
MACAGVLSASWSCDAIRTRERRSMRRYARRMQPFISVAARVRPRAQWRSTSRMACRPNIRSR